MQKKKKKKNKNQKKKKKKKKKKIGLKAEWHLFPTSHGKNMLETLKRLAACTSFQSSEGNS